MILTSDIIYIALAQSQLNPLLTYSIYFLCLVHILPQEEEHNWRVVTCNYAFVVIS